MPESFNASLGFVFPGQGSQSVGMLHALGAAYPVVQRTFDAASEVVGEDLWQLAQEGPEDLLNETARTQPVLLAAGVAVWRVWREAGGPMPSAMAGHSLGEYTALVCSGALELETGIALVADRGRFMQEAVGAGEGAMAAILGLSDAQVIEICERAAQGAIVTAANFNAPGQVVIAGDKAAVERAVELAKGEGAKRAVPLAVSVPSHCVLMRPAAERLAQRLQEVEIKAPLVPVVNNVDAKAPETPEAIRDALVRQLDHPVRWVECIAELERRGVRTLMECGPGKVLVGLNKRIARDMQALPLSAPEDLAAALEAVA